MMILKPLARLGTLATLATLLSAAAPFAVHAQQRTPVSPTELNYQAGTSPLGEVPMYQSANPKAPKMTQAEFELGRKTYFERCAGGTMTFQVAFICAMPNSGGTGGSCWI